VPVIGVGIDVVDIERFGDSLTRTPGLSRRLFTPAEASRPLASLAARFAAKEAMAKALGAPGDMHWHDAEVVSEASGRPLLELRGTVLARAEALGVTSVHLSLSHDAGIASAVVVLEG
jgi:holo-[acyl-carrier protein] synthase